MNPEINTPNGINLLCKNLVETDYTDLSEENIRIFKDRLLDITGCIFGGAIVPEDQFLVERLLDWGGKEEAPLFARSERLPLPNAVMINSITARANDFGNMFFHVFEDRIASHCGETLIPMGLTLADMQGTSGKDFITNNIASEDTIARILYTLPVRWPTDMLLVSSAAAALASRYYGLDAQQAKTALSYAATNATDPGESYYDYSQEFKYHNGAGAQMGIMAAEMAKGGWRGLKDPYFGHWGLVTKQITDGSPLPALYEKAFRDLGKVYFTEESFKRGPGGIPTTAAATCGAVLHDKISEAYGEFDAERIKKVHVYRSTSMRYNYYSNPFQLRNHTNALFSFQFAACCALLNGEVRVDLVQTPAILANEKLVELTENSTMDTFECEPRKSMMKVVVEMEDGKVFEDIEDYGNSMHDYPSREFLIKKFWDQFRAYGKLPESTGKKIIELADRIETVADMREYTQLLVLQK
ncbi:MAG: MmgE/PrpD family protein [Clostridiales bacterium]|nr:MmgE/PrpD family protein [Clostridiales bacterium]